MRPNMEDTGNMSLSVERRFELSVFKAKNLMSALDEAANLDVLCSPTTNPEATCVFSSKTTLVSETLVNM